MKAFLRKIPWPFILVAFFVAGFENAIWEWGYYRGHTEGATEMKCAIFGVLDGMTSTPPNPSDVHFTRLGCRTDAHGKVVKS